MLLSFGMLILFAWLSPVGLAASSRCWQFPFKYRSRLAWHQPVCFCFNCCISGVFSKKSLCVPVSGRLSQCFPLVVCWYQVMDRGLWSISDWFLYQMGVLLMVLHTQGPFYQHCLLKRLSFSPGFVSAGCRYVAVDIWTLCSDELHGSLCQHQAIWLQRPCTMSWSLTWCF